MFEFPRIEPSGFLPFGYRFYPTDEELVTDYLWNKINDKPFDLDIVIETKDVYAHEPWLLRHTSNQILKDNEWYYFVERVRASITNTNGKRPRRALEGDILGGWWKANDGDQPVVSKNGELLGYKKTLTFFFHQNKKRDRKDAKKSDWIMHEYRLASESFQKLVICRMRYTGKENLNLEGSTLVVSQTAVHDVRPMEGSAQALLTDHNVSGFSASYSSILHSGQEWDQSPGAETENPVCDVQGSGIFNSCYYIQDDGTEDVCESEAPQAFEIERVVVDFAGGNMTNEQELTLIQEDIGFQEEMEAKFDQIQSTEAPNLLVTEDKNCGASGQEGEGLMSEVAQKAANDIAAFSFSSGNMVNGQETTLESEANEYAGYSATMLSQETCVMEGVSDQIQSTTAPNLLVTEGQNWGTSGQDGEDLSTDFAQTAANHTECFSFASDNMVNGREIALAQTAANEIECLSFASGNVINGQETTWGTMLWQEACEMEGVTDQIESTEASNLLVTEGENHGASGEDGENWIADFAPTATNDTYSFSYDEVRDLLN